MFWITITKQILWRDTVLYLTKVSTLLPYTCFATTTVGPMVLNAFAHPTGLEVGSLFDDSAPSIVVNMSEYTGEPSDLSVQQIPPASVGHDIGKVAQIRRVPGSKEPPNGLVPEARSSPRSLASVPPYFLDITQTKSFGKLFLQPRILPLPQAKVDGILVKDAVLRVNLNIDVAPNQLSACETCGFLNSRF